MHNLNNYNSLRVTKTEAAVSDQVLSNEEEKAQHYAVLVTRMSTLVCISFV